MTHKEFEAHLRVLRKYHKAEKTGDVPKALENAARESALLMCFNDLPPNPTPRQIIESYATEQDCFDHEWVEESIRALGVEP